MTDSPNLDLVRSIFAASLLRAERHAFSWFEGGKIARAAGYAPRREALEAVELEG